MGMGPQYFHTIPTSCAIFPICIGFISHVNTRVVEGSGVDVVLHWCEVHDYVHGEDMLQLNCC